MPVLRYQALVDNRVLAIQNFHRLSGLDRAQLDVSGGIDSALMLGILARALGPNKITATYTSVHSSEDSHQRAIAVANTFNVELIDLNISEIFDELLNTMIQGLSRAGHSEKMIRNYIAEDPSVLGSFRSCIRAPIGRAFNRLTRGGLRHGTGNECEDRFIRFFQKGGDGEVDSNPIAMLSKGEVFQLASFLGVPSFIVEAIPSPDLHGIGSTHNDEDELKTLAGVAWTYSRVNPKTREYLAIGTIEAMSRFLDRNDHQAVLFRSQEPTDNDLGRLAAKAGTLEFESLPENEIVSFLRSARRLESNTRHKANPNCPTLGNRKQLIESGILTNTLPKVPLSHTKTANV